MNESAYNYIQKVDWELYANKKQTMTSEREYVIAALLNHDPDTSLKLRTLSDIFNIKNKGGHFRMRSQKIQFLQKCHEQLKTLKYNSKELENIKQFINTQSVELGLNKDQKIPIHFLTSNPDRSCNCLYCKNVTDIFI